MIINYQNDKKKRKREPELSVGKRARSTTLCLIERENTRVEIYKRKKERKNSFHKLHDIVLTK
jgi:hypothetical protein